MLNSFLSKLSLGLERARDRSFCSIILCSLTVILLSFVIASQNLVVVRDGYDLKVLTTFSDNPETALREAGVMLKADDTVRLPIEPISGVAEVVINRSHTALISADGIQVSLSAVDDTVATLIEKAGFELGNSDEVSPALETPVTEDVSITIVRVGTKTETITEVIPYDTVKKPSIYINKGTEVLKQQGEPGQKTMVYEISLKDGVEVSRTLISDEVDIPPVDHIVEYGSGGTLTTPDGQVLNFLRVIEGQATAYTTEGYAQKRNALGRIARTGTIAVDPRVIPMQSKVYVAAPNGKNWVYGTAVAEDTGGAVKGNIVDLFFDTRAECYNFGRRKCRIYILE